MWISLPWKLQDVQAALNVIIAFLCAGSVFVLVRTFWLVAARKVGKKKDIPAHALLSLNTVGEAIDVVWLLRHELLTARYRGLLVQCIAVLFLTLCTLGSGWIARFSTRSVTDIVPTMVQGSLATRDTGSLYYDNLDISATYYALEKADFSYTKLAEFWPDPDTDWQYNDEQWMNGSWSMECTYNETVPISNAISSGTNCTNGLIQQWPWLLDFWWDWNTKEDATAGWRDAGITWSNTNDTINDILYFMHGLDIPHWDEQDGVSLARYLRVRTVALHLHSLPQNPEYDSNDPASCQVAEGPIQEADYTSVTCALTRDFGTRTGNDLAYWGASADIGDFERVASAYTQFYAGRVRRESGANLPLSKITGHELARFYQAYQVVKDTSGTLYYNTTESVAPLATRLIDVRARVVQVSLTCLIVCSAMTLIVLIGVLHYWLFLICNFRRLDKTPQSKLDWMLQTLKTENESPRTKARHKLRTSISSSSDLFSDTTPLNKLDLEDGRTKSMTSSITTREVEADEIAYGSPESRSYFSPPSTSSAQGSWSPFQASYQQHTSRNDYGLGIGRNGYSKMTSPPPGYYPAQGWDTSYDGSRRQ